MSSTAGRIAYITLNGDLEVANSDGMSRRSIASGDRFFHFPAWSPDGRRIAAIGGNRERDGIYVFEDEDALMAVVEPTAEHTAYESSRNPPIYLYWSPDSSHISFIAARAEEQSMGLHLASAHKAAMKEGSRPNLLAVGRPCFWHWSPDARHILVHCGGWDDDASAKLTTIDPFAPQSPVIDSVNRPGFFQSPCIAPDGRHRAFGQITRKNELELVIDGVAALRGERRIVVKHTGVAAMSWSPVAAELAFICPPENMRTYYGPLRLLNGDSGDVRLLAEDIVLAFFWSPDGKSIAYFTVAQAAESIRDLIPDPDEIARDGGFYIDPALDDEARNGDADGDGEGDDTGDRGELWLNLWVVDVQSGEERLIQTFEPVDIFVNQFLPFFDQYAKSHRIWSPESDAMVLPMMRSNASGDRIPTICVVKTAAARAGELYEVAGGLVAFWRPC
jgi:TolB protein